MNQETPLTIEFRAFSNNPDVRSGKDPITVFDVLQWLYANTDRDLKPNITADGSIYLTVSLMFNNGFLHRKIAQWDIRYPYLDQQPTQLLKDIANCKFIKKII